MIEKLDMFMLTTLTIIIPANRFTLSLLGKVSVLNIDDINSSIESNTRNSWVLDTRLTNREAMIRPLDRDDLDQQLNTAIKPARYV